MTRRKPRTFTPEFRQMAVDLALQGDQSIAQIERDLGLSDGLLRQWVKKHAAAKAVGKTVEQAADERREVKRLQREVARLQEEVAILKKAVVIFAHPSPSGSNS